MRITQLALLLALAAPARAAETAAFLKIGVGARAVSLGGAYTAVADDANAISWNPAGLSLVRKKELGATHADLALDTRYDFLGYAQPTRLGTFAAGAGYLSQGAIPGRDASGQPTGSFTAADSVLNLGYATRPCDLRLGGNVKIIQSRIANVSAAGFAVDVGLQKDLFDIAGPGVPVLGLAVQNLGPGMRYLDQAAPLPLTVAVGAGYRLRSGLTLAVDFKNRPNEHSSELSVGTEYALFTSFALRAGYSTLGETGLRPGQAGGGAAPSALTGLGGGFGIRFRGYALDYSMTPFGELGNVQRFSFGARF